MALRLRRGTNAERLLITPEEGELIYTTDSKKIFAGDGVSVGGNIVSGINNVIEDVIPQLGGNLNLNTYNITGNGSINITNSITTQSSVNSESVNTTGNITTAGNFIGDLIGSVFSDSSTLLTDGVNGRHILDNNSIEDLGNVTINFGNLEDQQALVYNSNTGTWGNVSIGVGDTYQGTVIGDLIGSVFADDSAILVDAIAGKVLLENNVIGEIGDIAINYDLVQDGDVLTWNAATQLWSPAPAVPQNFFADINGSVFSNDSTLMVDGINARINLDNNPIGDLSNVTVNLFPDSYSLLYFDPNTLTWSATDLQEIWNNSAQFPLEATGNFTGNFLSIDSTVIMNSTDMQLRFQNDNMFGSKSAALYDGFLDGFEPVIVLGSRTTPNQVFIEGDKWPLVVRGECDNIQGASIGVQSARFSNETLLEVQQNDVIGQLSFEGFDGSVMRKGTIITSKVDSALNSGNWDNTFSISLLQANGLYQPYTFSANGTLSLVAVDYATVDDATLTAFSGIAPEGAMTYGLNRKAPVVFNGTAFLTVPTIVGVPASTGATGLQGQISGDANYIYFCYATDSWIRVAKDGTW